MEQMEQTILTVAKRRTLLRTTLVALFAGLICAGTFIAVPLPFTPVPVVLQNLFSLLAGLLLGPVLGAASVGLYLIAGLLGAPVFSGAGGGLPRFIGPTGGYLFGYLLGAFVAGLAAGRPRGGVKTPLWRITLAVIAGTLVVYVPGVLRLKAVLETGWGQALAAGFLPFLIGDAVKAAVAVIISPRLRRAAGDCLDQ